MEINNSPLYGFVLLRHCYIECIAGYETETIIPKQDKLLRKLGGLFISRYLRAKVTQEDKGLYYRDIQDEPLSSRR